MKYTTSSDSSSAGSSEELSLLTSSLKLSCDISGFSVDTLFTSSLLEIVSLSFSVLLILGSTLGLLVLGVLLPPQLSKVEDKQKRNDKEDGGYIQAVGY